MFNKMISKLRGNRSGFTLMELIIVMVVIGVLVALAVPKFGEFRNKAEVAKMQNDIKVVENLTALSLMEKDLKDVTFEAKTGNAVTKYGKKVVLVEEKLTDVDKIDADLIENSGTNLAGKGTFLTDKDGQVFFQATDTVLEGIIKDLEPATVVVP